MKVSVKSVLKTSDHDFECFEDQRVIFRTGNMLCIREIDRGECQFITLQRHVDHLYSFKVSSNKKFIFVAEKHANEVQLCQYSISSEHRAISLTAESSFFSNIESLELLMDEFDNSLIYGAAKSKESACIFLADMNKMKVMAIGFLGLFTDFKIDGRENMTVSVCGYEPNNYIKCLRYGAGQWEMYEQTYKKIQDPAIQHEILYGGRQLLITSVEIHIFEENQLVQTISFPEAASAVVEVLKVPKGLVVRFADESLRLLVEDSDETTFVHMGKLGLELLPGERIAKMVTSHNLEEVVIRTSVYNLYVWRCEHLSINSDRSELIFNRIYNSCSFSPEGSISISTGKKYCLLTGTTNATIWSIERNEMVLSVDFGVPQKRMLFAGAINPDGNSVLLAFEDRVRLYRILFTKFKLACEFPIKRCQTIIYSHGGQLAACRFGKGINSCVTIVNMLRLVELCTFKLQAEPRQLIWNELDEELIISTENNTIQIYRISQATRVHNIKLPEELTQVRIDYKTKQIVASSEKGIFLVQDGQIVERLPPPIPNFHYIFPLYNVYFAATKTGELLWSYSNRFESYHELPLFSNRTFSMVCRNGYLLAYASFEDITVLRCERSTPTINKKGGDEDIVMVERDQMLSFFQKVKNIESSFQILTTATQAKLEEEKQKYQLATAKHRQAFEKEIAFLNSKLAELNIEKQRQQRESEKIFQGLEQGQVRNITDLERMYDRKYDLEKEKYLNLEQAFLEQKMRYEKLLLEIQAKYHSEVVQVREEYAGRVKEEALRVQSIKNANLTEKAGMEMKLIDLEEENELTLCDLQQAGDSALQQLLQRQAKLEEDYEQAQIRIHNQEADMRMLQAEAKERRAETLTLRQRVASFESRVALLERQIQRKEATINNKNQVIEEQAHQIAGLQKAKYVLSFRTTEIRKELEPKEEQVDKLKAEMFKMEEEFREEKKRNGLLLSRLEKMQRINDISKREVADLRIALKHRQRTHDDLCAELFTLVNNTDAKDWNPHIIRLYQTYIHEDKHQNRGKNSDDTSQQLSRHLRHVEESLMQVTSGAEKVLRGKEKEVMRKMKENSELVYELNVMRKKENDFAKERRDLSNENARLKRQLNETLRTTTSRSQTATGFTRRIITSRETREKSLNLEIQDLEKSKAEVKSSRVEKHRLVSARRTLLLQDEKKQKQSKVFDIARELESARSTIKRQDRMIEQLNQRLLGSNIDT